MIIPSKVSLNISELRERVWYKPRNISENIRVSELCIKGSALNDQKQWAVHLYSLFEQLYNQLNSKYLVLFFLPEDTRYLSSPSGQGVGWDFRFFLCNHGNRYVQIL